MRAQDGLDFEASGRGTLRQHATAGLTDITGGANAPGPGHLGENPGYRRHEGGSTLSRRRRRLPGDALIKLDVGLGLAEEVPVRHRLGSILSGGRSAGSGDRRWLGGLADMGEDPLHWGGFGDEGSALLGVRCHSESGRYPCGDHCRFWVVCARSQSDTWVTAKQREPVRQGSVVGVRFDRAAARRDGGALRP